MNWRYLAFIDWLSLIYLLGTVISLGFLRSFPTLLLLVAFLILAWLGLNFRQSRKALKSLVLLLAFLLSLFRGAGSFRQDLPLGKLTLKGFVSESPTVQGNSQRFGFETKQGISWIKTTLYGQTFSYGDILEISGDFHEGYGASVVSFPKITKLDGRGGSPFFEFSYSLRDRFKKSLGQILPEPENSLATGILLGTRGLDNKIFTENLRITGTSHIVSVSGYNISILITGLIMILSSVGNTVLIVLLTLIVLIFDAMVGFTPPVLRATFMGFFLLLARILGRQQNITDALLVSAALIAMLNPQSLLTISFQLSFLATVGIIYLYPYISVPFKTWPKVIGGTLAATLAAQLAVLPIVLYNFGAISLISPLANVLVDWTVPPLMVLSFLTGLFGQLSLPLGQFFGALDFVLLNYFVRVIGFLAKIPGAAIHI